MQAAVWQGLWLALDDGALAGKPDAAGCEHRRHLLGSGFRCAGLERRFPGRRTILSPVVMNVLLVRVSGVAMLGKSMAAKPGYAEDAKKTPAFFPKCSGGRLFKGPLSGRIADNPRSKP